MPISRAELIDAATLAEARAFLEAHEESAQFLLNGLALHGPRITEHPNSGNFKLIRGGGGVEGVFCLARRGNLLVQANGDHSELILRACEAEAVPIRGFIGHWDSVEPVRRAFQRVHPEFRPTFDSKEILYALPLRPDSAQVRHDPRARFLVAADFPQWLALAKAYLEELRLPDDLSAEEKRRAFLEQVDQRCWWGLFAGGELVARTALNSKGSALGQVGGVFTPRQHRQKGYAKATMLHMLKDCRDVHGHRKSILFTGETDFPAQRLYESLGYGRAGSFALVLS